MQDGSHYCEFGDFGPALDREALDMERDYLTEAEEADMYAEQDEETSRDLLSCLA